MSNATAGGRPGEHAVYPGTFDPLTPGHLDFIERARYLFARITVVVAVNGPSRELGQRLGRRVGRVDRRVLPAVWASVIIRGVRNQSDLSHEYQLAAMNETLGVTTLLLPAKPGLAAMSSTVLRGLGI